jgi:hypothetical protein
MLANTYKSKQHVLANGAPRHNARTFHVYMRFGKVLYRAAVRTLSLGSRNIHSEYFAQLTCGCVTVKIIISM